MNMDMYSIKDELNGFSPMIPIQTEELAKRYFKDQCEGNITIKNSPEDFSIWKLGTFDTDAGNFINEPNGAKLVERAKNYVSE